MESCLEGFRFNRRKIRTRRMQSFRLRFMEPVLVRMNDSIIPSSTKFYETVVSTNRKQDEMVNNHRNSNTNGHLHANHNIVNSSNSYDNPHTNSSKGDSSISSSNGNSNNRSNVNPWLLNAQGSHPAQPRFSCPQAERRSSAAAMLANAPFVLPSRVTAKALVGLPAKATADFWHPSPPAVSASQQKTKTKITSPRMESCLEGFRFNRRKI